MRFILFVEGYTEDKALPSFLKKWLDPQLASAVGIRTVRFDGWPELVKDARGKAALHLNGPMKDEIIAVISLLDLYGPTFYPQHLGDPEERYAWAKADIEGKVGNSKFFQFFAVHEVEAWLLSQPEIFPPSVVRAFPGRIQQPETVNFDEPPARLLDRLYSMHLRQHYKKIVNGRELFSKLDPNIAYQKCPKLKALLDKMLELAQAAQ